MHFSGVDSIVQIEIWKREGYTADYIAGAFGYTRQGLNKKIKRTKAALEQSGGTTTTDEEEGGKHRHSTSPTDEETQ
jgi:hypothetical protein